MEKYLVPDYTDVHEFLSHLGKRLGKLKKGKIVKLNVWNEWSKNYSILLGLFYCLNDNYCDVHYGKGK